MAEKAVSARTYLVTLLCLLALTALSYFLSTQPLGELEMVVALLIAVAKGTLVVLFFMHLIHAQVSSVVVLLTTIAFVCILVGLMAADIATRFDPTG
jgi:cytochrome c oxidase subunit 4